MAGCYVERRSVAAASSLSWDLTHHLFTRQLEGVIYIVSVKPGKLLSALAKQWYKIARQAERERASTLNADRIMELMHEVSNMQRLRFAAEESDERLQEGVFLVTPDQLNHVPANCHTLYLTDAVSMAHYAKIVDMMPRHGLIVTYTD